MSVRLPNPGLQWLQAKVLYASPTKKIFDIALIQMVDYRPPSAMSTEEISPVERLEEGKLYLQSVSNIMVCLNI